MGAKSGGKRKITQNQNTSISAVATLSCSAEDAIDLVLYHNCFAACPLAPALFARYGVPQYELGEAGEGEIAQWVKCPQRARERGG